MHINDILRERDTQRRIEATGLARAALAALRDAGFSAWLFGSLARGTFKQHSDIDVLIDTTSDRKTEALVICLRALKGFPSSIVFKNDVPAHVLPYLLEEAVDEPRLETMSPPTTTPT